MLKNLASKLLILLGLLIVPFFSLIGQSSNIVRVTDLSPGPTSSIGYFNRILSAPVEFRGELYFAGRDSSGIGYELWKLDSQKVPVLAFDLLPGSGSAYPQEMMVFKDKLIFSAFDTVAGREPWMYDGINPPSRIADIFFGKASSNPAEFTQFEDVLVFKATGDSLNDEPWQWDGINPPTLVADINTTRREGSLPRYFTLFDSALYFAAFDNINGYEVRRYDGINPPTLVADIDPGVGFPGGPGPLIVYQNKLYWNQFVSGTGNELYVYDGVNPAGLDRDIRPGSLSSTPVSKIVYKGNMVFECNANGATGNEPHVYDGVNAPVLLRDILPGSSGSNTSQFFVYNDRLYFSAASSAPNFTFNGELWVYDGLQSPFQVAEINPTGPAFPLGFAEFRGEMYFLAQNDSFGIEMWKFACDSTFSNETITACDTYLWSANNTTYTQSGLYTATLTNKEGCDSIATLNLTINQSSFAGLTDTACDQYIWPVNGQTYTASGFYTEILTRANGCDSIIQLQLTIEPGKQERIDIIGCDSASFNGQIYTRSDTLVDVLTAANGCDSTITTFITVNASQQGVVMITACDSFRWNATGQVYTQSGQYVANLQTVTGCDSTLMLDVTINSGFDTTLSIIACDSFQWDANGQVYTQSGQYQASFLTTEGCDSMLQIDLTIIPSVDTTLSLATCDSALIGGIWYTQSDTISQNLTSVAGCDSTVITQLTINAIDTSVARLTSANFLQAVENNATYQWLNCDSGLTAIAMATGQSFTATKNGFYAVEITNAAGCIDTSACVQVTGISNDVFPPQLTLTVFPNPAFSQITVEISRPEPVHVMILNALGEVVCEKKGVRGQQVIEIENWANGLYQVRAISAKGEGRSAFIKR